MPLFPTRAAADSVLIDRVGKVFALAGLSTAIDGSNPETVEPWRYSLGTLGIVPAGYPAVADGDFAAITAATLPQLLDVAELAARRQALDALEDVDQQQDRDKMAWDQLAGRWRQRIEDLDGLCRRSYGIGLATLSGGSIDLGFQEPACPSDPWW